MRMAAYCPPSTTATVAIAHRQLLWSPPSAPSQLGSFWSATPAPAATTKHESTPFSRKPHGTGVAATGAVVSNFTFRSLSGHASTTISPAMISS
jgi:hypothetical protein